MGSPRHAGATPNPNPEPQPRTTHHYPYPYPPYPYPYPNPNPTLATQAAPHGPASEARRRGVHVQPTIAVSRANLKPIEIEQAVAAGRLKVDGKILQEGRVVEHYPLP